MNGSLLAASTVNNARLLDPVGVASFFVPPPFFRQLFSLRNQLLVGPRGSGKTTLLKMLRLPALRSWRGGEANWARENVPFVGVFVPADVSWTGRLRSQVESVDDLGRSYARAALSCLVMRSIVEAFTERTRSSIETTGGFESHVVALVSMSKNVEVALCERLAAAWRLPAAVPTLLGLRSSLSEALVDLRSALEKFNDSGDRKEFSDACNRRSRPIVDSVRHAVDVFEEVTGSPSVKWALLFDELEIAPDWLQEELLSSLRSTDQRLVFKLAITPCGGAAAHVGGVTQPHVDADYDEIPLWYSESRDALRFCGELWESLLSARGMQRATPTSVFGESIDEDVPPRGAVRSSRYQLNGVWSKAIQSLAKKDPSFSAYLRRRDVWPSRLGNLDRAKMDSVVRKVAPIAHYRDYFLDFRVQGDNRLGPVRRSRKKVVFYSGSKSIFRVTEGNPRWYLSLVGQLVELWRAQGKTISRQQQADAVEAFAGRFLSTVASYPNPALSTARQLGSDLTVTTLLSTIGSAAFEEVAGKHFKEDPRLSVRIDRVSPALDALLSIAVNSGALVLEDRSEGASSFVESLQGRVVRISYHLAPYFRLPLRSGKPMALSRILDRDPGERSAGGKEAQIEFSAFEIADDDE